MYDPGVYRYLLYNYSVTIPYIERLGFDTHTHTTTSQHSTQLPAVPPEADLGSLWVPVTSIDLRRTNPARRWTVPHADLQKGIQVTPESPVEAVEGGLLGWSQFAGSCLVTSKQSGSLSQPLESWSWSEGGMLRHRMRWNTRPWNPAAKNGRQAAQRSQWL